MRHKIITSTPGELVGRQIRRDQARAPIQRSAAMLISPLSRPARFCGTVDASHERGGMMPRTIEQALGPASRGTLIGEPPVDTSFGHKVATFVSLTIAILVGCALLAEAYL